MNLTPAAMADQADQARRLADAEARLRRMPVRLPRPASSSGWAVVRWNITTTEDLSEAVLCDRSATTPGQLVWIDARASVAPGALTDDGGSSGRAVSPVVKTGQATRGGTTRDLYRVIGPSFLTNNSAQLEQWSFRKLAGGTWEVYNGSAAAYVNFGSLSYAAHAFLVHTDLDQATGDLQRFPVDCAAWHTGGSGSDTTVKPYISPEWFVRPRRRRSVSLNLAVDYGEPMHIDAHLVITNVDYRRRHLKLEIDTDGKTLHWAMGGTVYYWNHTTYGYAPAAFAHWASSGSPDWSSGSASLAAPVVNASGTVSATDTVTVACTRTTGRRITAVTIDQTWGTVSSLQTAG